MMLFEVGSQVLEIALRITVALVFVVVTLRLSLVLLGIHLIKESQRGNKAAALLGVGLMLLIGLIAALLK